MLGDSTKIILIVTLVIAVALIILPVKQKIGISNLLSPILLLPVNVTNKLLSNFYVVRENLMTYAERCNRLALENELLREKLQLLGDSAVALVEQYDLLPAQIVARDLITMNHFLFVNKGMDDMVPKLAPVVYLGGVVGNINESVARRSTIETILSPGFHVSSKIKRNGLSCMTSATNEGLLANYVMKDGDVMVGDTVQTSGLSEIFPAGMNVATVIRIEPGKDMFFKKVFLRPIVEIARLQKVYIVLPRAKPLPKKVLVNRFSDLIPKIPSYTPP